MWSLPALSKSFLDGIAKPASGRADGRVGLMEYWTEQARNLPGQAAVTLSTKDEDPGVVLAICLRFTDSPVFVPHKVSKPTLPAFEKCRERWGIQPGQVTHGLGP